MGKYVVGVTGHRDLCPEELDMIQLCVRELLKKIQAEHSQDDIIMINSLAAGADCLCAEQAVDLGYCLIVPLPVSEDIYRLDFTKEEETLLDDLRKKAMEEFVVPAAQGQSRNERFRQAGLYIAQNCDVLIALWDGDPGTEGGCGTAETVEFVLDPKKHGICKENAARVVQIHVGRRSKNSRGTISISDHYPVVTE